MKLKIEMYLWWMQWEHGMQTNWTERRFTLPSLTNLKKEISMKHALSNKIKMSTKLAPLFWDNTSMHDFVTVRAILSLDRHIGLVPLKQGNKTIMMASNFNKRTSNISSSSPSTRCTWPMVFVKQKTCAKFTIRIVLCVHSSNRIMNRAKSK